MRQALFLVLAILLAGCSDGGDGSGSGSTASASMTTTGPPPKPVVLSDTLHLLAPPDMAPALPSGSSETSTPTDGGFGGGPGGGGQEGPQAEWTYQVTANSTVTSAEVHVWIEITDTLAPSPFQNPFDQGQQCTWLVVLEMGADGEPETGCLVEPPGPINPGTKELVFDVVGIGAEMEAGETITLSFHRNAFSASAENSVFVLSGSEAHDSRAVLNGLEEPVPDA